MADNDRDSRLWGVLETIEKRLSAIEVKLEKIIRLEERVTKHDQVITRLGKRLDAGDERIRKVEMWQSEHNPEMIISTLKANADSIELVKKELSEITSRVDVDTGHKDIGKEVLKWVASILAALLIYQVTRRM